jgi:hypothetical protein
VATPTLPTLPKILQICSVRTIRVTAPARIGTALATSVWCTLIQRLQGHCTCMVKKPFTTRLDEHVLALAQRIAEAERRSVTSVIEIAVLDYAAKVGVSSERPPA